MCDVLLNGRTWTADGPRRPLLHPAPRVRHGSQRPLAHGLGAVDRFERQDRHLQVGREQEQVEQLRHPSPREPELARHGCPVGRIGGIKGLFA